MVVWRGESGPADGAAITFDAAEFGRASLMAVVENDLVRAMLWQSCAAAPGIRLEPQARAADVAPGPGQVALTLADGRRIHARLVVGAEGHDSWLRSALGVPVDAHGYGQSAIVAHVAGELPHADTAWQRFLPDGPLAFLPLREAPKRFAEAMDDDFNTAAALGALFEAARALNRLAPADPAADLPATTVAATSSQNESSAWKAVRTSRGWIARSACHDRTATSVMTATGRIFGAWPTSQTRSRPSPADWRPWSATDNSSATVAAPTACPRPWT